MKKALLSLVLVFCITAVTAQVQRDKALHFVGGNLYGLAGAGIAKQISKGNRWWTFAGSLGGATLIGLGKEAVDASQRENGWDNDDLLATILGGATVGFTIDVFTNHKRNREHQQLRKRLNLAQQLKQTKRSKRLERMLQKQQLPSLTTLSLSDGFMGQQGL